MSSEGEEEYLVVGRSSSSSPFYTLSSANPLGQDASIYETDNQGSISPTFRQPSLSKPIRLESYGLRRITQETTEVKSEEEQDEDSEVSLQGRLTFPMRLPARSFTANYQQAKTTDDATTDNDNGMTFTSPQIQKYSSNDEFKSELFGEPKQENMYDSNGINGRASVNPKPLNTIINHQKNFSFRCSVGLNNEADESGLNNSKLNGQKSNNQIAQTRENEVEFGQKYVQDSQMYYYKPTESFESPMPLSFSNEKEQAVINRINDFSINSPSELKKKYVHDQVEKLCEKNENELNWGQEIQLGQQKTLLSSRDLCGSQQKEIKELRNKLRIFTDILEKIHRINKKKKDTKQMQIIGKSEHKQSEAAAEKEAKILKTNEIEESNIELVYSQQSNMQSVSVQKEQDYIEEEEKQRRLDKDAADKEEEHSQALAELQSEIGQVYAAMFAQEEEFKTKLDLKEKEILQLKSKLQAIEIEGMKKAEQIRSLLDQINKEQTHICVFQDNDGSNNINNNNNSNIHNYYTSNSFTANNNNNNILNLKNVSNSNTNNNIISYDEADDEEDDEDNSNNNQLHAPRNHSNYRSQRNSMKNSRGSGMLQSTKNNSQHSFKNLIAEQQEEILFEQEEQFQEQQQDEANNVHIQHYSPCSQEIYTSSSQEQSSQPSSNNVAEKEERIAAEGCAVQVDEERGEGLARGEFEDACDRISERLELQPSQSDSQQLESQGVYEQRDMMEGQSNEQENCDVNQVQGNEQQQQQQQCAIADFTIMMEQLLQGMYNQSALLSVSQIDIRQLEQGYAQDQLFLVGRVIFEQLDMNNKYIECLYEKLNQLESYLQQEQEKQLTGQTENKDAVEIQDQVHQQEQQYQQREQMAVIPEECLLSENSQVSPLEIVKIDKSKMEMTDLLKTEIDESQSTQNEHGEASNSNQKMSVEQQIQQQEEIEQKENDQNQQHEDNAKMSHHSHMIDSLKEQNPQNAAAVLPLPSPGDDQKMQEDRKKMNDSGTQTTDLQKEEEENRDKALIQQLLQQNDNLQREISLQKNQIKLLNDQISQIFTDNHRLKDELGAARQLIEENKRVIKNKQQLIEQLQRELDNVKAENQASHAKELLMMEAISGKMNLQFENNHTTWTKEEVEEIIIRKKKKRQEKQQRQEEATQTDYYVSSEYMHLLAEYQKQSQQLERSQTSNTAISQQLSSVTAELAHERAAKIARDVEMKGKPKQEENQESNIMVRVTEALIRNRNDLAKDIFESISYFLRELHGHIQGHQTLFMKRIYTQAYEKLEKETEAFNKETQIAFDNMITAVNPLEYLPSFYEPLKSHMHETLLELLDILCQILKNQKGYDC